MSYLFYVINFSFYDIIFDLIQMQSYFTHFHPLYYSLSHPLFLLFTLFSLLCYFLPFTPYLCLFSKTFDTKDHPFKFVDHFLILICLTFSRSFFPFSSMKLFQSNFPYFPHQKISENKSFNNFPTIFLFQAEIVIL
jgi:hypothetical protein